MIYTTRNYGMELLLLTPHTHHGNRPQHFNLDTAVELVYVSRNKCSPVH